MPSFFLSLPAWFGCGLLYIVFAEMTLGCLLLAACRALGVGQVMPVVRNLAALLKLPFVEV